MRVVNVGIGDPSPAIPTPPATTTSTHSLKERVGDGFPILAVLTLVGALVGAVIKLSQDA